MDNVKNLILKCGWGAAKSLLTTEYLVNRVCNNDPLVFLSFYYDPNPIETPQDNKRVVFRCQPTNNFVFFLHKKKNKVSASNDLIEVSASNDLIMDILRKDFGLTNMEDIHLVIKEWFKKMYNVNVGSVRHFYNMG